MKVKSPVKSVKVTGIADRSFCKSPVYTHSRVSAAFCCFSQVFITVSQTFQIMNGMAVPSSFKVSQVRVKMDSQSK